MSSKRVLAPKYVEPLAKHIECFTKLVEVLRREEMPEPPPIRVDIGGRTFTLGGDR